MAEGPVDNAMGRIGGLKAVSAFLRAPWVFTSVLILCAWALTLAGTLWLVLPRWWVVDADGRPRASLHVGLGGGCFLLQIHDCDRSGPRFFFLDGRLALNHHFQTGASGGGCIGQPKRWVYLPLTYPLGAAIIAAMGMRWVPSLRRRRRGGAGRCPACSYDLRGLSEDSRCPECGSARVSYAG